MESLVRFRKKYRSDVTVGLLALSFSELYAGRSWETVRRFYPLFSDGCMDNHCTIAGFEKGDRSPIKNRDFATYCLNWLLPGQMELSTSVIENLKGAFRQLTNQK